MTRPLTGKAEVVLEYPEKLFIGTFDRNDRFEARLETNEVLLTLRREGGTEACREARLHVTPQVFANVLCRLAESPSASLPPLAVRQTLRVAAEALARALAEAARQDADRELTPDEEVLLLHVME